jgi:SAM-dependent methyltransferase
VKLADRTILTSPEFQTGQVSPHVLRSLGKAVRFLASSRGTLRENAVTYVIKGGREGKNRLSVIADALQPTTARLIDKAGKIEAGTIVDAACGGGDVCLYLADLAGPTGKVVGFDLDGEKLAIAREQANARGLSNIEFVQANVLAPWPVEGADLVYARFILAPGLGEGNDRVVVEIHHISSVSILRIGFFLGRRRAFVRGIGQPAQHL